MELNTVVSEIKGKVGIITLNRPKALNAVSEEMLRELTSQTKAFDEDPWVRAIIIRGSDKAFAAGIDVRDLIEKVNSRDTELLKMHKYMETFAATRKPLIAAVAGFALGIGCEIALNCDIILAADNAKFGQPELSLASIPCFGATQLLTKAIGKAKAMEVILSGRAINAEEAERTGLVSRIIPLTDLYDECYKVAAKIAEQSDLAVSTAKQAIKQAAANTPLATGIALENQSSRMYLNSEDFRESLADFIRKHS